MYKYLLIVGSIVAFLITITSSSCTYNNEEELYPVSDCDTVGVAYLAVVQPIISQACYSCHNQANYLALGAGYDLETFSSLKSLVDNGRLLCAINHDAGCSAMPKGGLKMPACNILKIEAWVAAGAPEN